MTHKHKPYESGDDFSFLGCVNPDNCNPAAHGGIVRDEKCICGAKRTVAINWHRYERAAWQEEETRYDMPGGDVK